QDSFWSRKLVSIARTSALERCPAARGESLAAFDGRCIPAGCVAPRSNTPGIAPHRAQHARWGPRRVVVAPFGRGPHGADCAPWGGGGRIAALGATLDFHHRLLALLAVVLLCSAPPARAQVTLTPGPEQITVDIDGKPFSVFYIGGKDLNRPYLHPIRSASGKIVNRSFPAGQLPGETTA